MACDDDIKLAIIQKPQLRIKSQPCKQCGNPNLSMGSVCSYCLNRRFMDEALRQQARAFADHPKVELTIAKEKNVKHAVLIGHPGWSFCGIRPTESIPKRIKVLATKLPQDLCPVCWDRIRRAKEGVTE